MIEPRDVGRQGVGEVVDDRPHPVLSAVEDGIADGEAGQFRLQFDTQDRAIWHACGEAEADRADARAEVEHALPAGGVDRSGQQYRVHCDTIPTRWLQ